VPHKRTLNKKTAPEEGAAPKKETLGASEKPVRSPGEASFRGFVMVVFGKGFDNLAIVGGMPRSSEGKTTMDTPSLDCSQEGGFRLMGRKMRGKENISKRNQGESSSKPVRREDLCEELDDYGL